MHNNSIKMTQNQVPQNNVLSLNMINNEPEEDIEETPTQTRGLHIVEEDNMNDNNIEQEYEEEQPEKKQNIFRRFINFSLYIKD